MEPSAAEYLSVYPEWMPRRYQRPLTQNIAFNIYLVHLRPRPLITFRFFLHLSRHYLQPVERCVLYFIFFLHCLVRVVY